MKAADPKYCTGRIMAIKKGVNHSNNKERCSAGNLYDLLSKVLQIKVRRLLKAVRSLLKRPANVHLTEQQK